MFRPEEIFATRMRLGWQRGIRITATVLSGGGTPVFLLAILLGLIIGYRYFLEWLPANFPIEIPIAVLLSWFLIKRAVLRTWLLPADLTFLLPAEGQMKGYIQASARYSWVIAMVQLLAIVLLLHPLYQFRFAANQPVWSWILFLAVLVTWNLWSSWLETHLTFEQIALRVIQIFRAILNFWLIFLFLWIASPIWLFSLVVPICFSFYLLANTKKTLFPWRKLLDQEAQVQSQYRKWAEMLVDLPFMPRRITPRKAWVNTWNRLVPVSKQSMHLFLFSRIVLRDREIFSQYVLLSFWSLLLSWSIPFPGVPYLIYLLSLFFWSETISKLISTTHLPLPYHLLPKDPTEVVSSRQKVHFWLTLSFAIWVSLLLGVTTILTPLAAIITLGLGILFSFYVRQKARRAV
ncbi:ABC transporter permease [Risungbinella massiliensis]|uniref:ABC transporter permease n=1 Tax=Risungbinella massiliensis TaxID=1329796 RepID=UPI0005CBEC14|nr:ABC transporter permease [Risungbinella massiliensis]